MKKKIQMKFKYEFQEEEFHVIPLANKRRGRNTPCGSQGVPSQSILKH